MTPRYSIILPIYDQALQLASIVERNNAALETLDGDHEQLLVINSDHDGSLEAAEDVAKSNPRVRVLRANKGWGSAVMTGLNAATGEFLCYTNSARTKPADLALVLRYGTINSESLVKASRKIRESVVRRTGSVIYNFETRMLFSLAVWDVNGTPKVFHRDILPRLRLTETGDLIDVQLLSRCQTEGIRVVEVPIYDSTRHSGRSTTNFRSAARMYIGAWRLHRKIDRGQQEPLA